MVSKFDLWGPWFNLAEMLILPVARLGAGGGGLSSSVSQGFGGGFELRCTEWGRRIQHWKGRETKQQPVTLDWLLLNWL